MRPIYFLLLILIIPHVHAQDLVEALQECPGTLTGSTDPQQIHLQSTNDNSEMIVIWATEQRSDAIVEWNNGSSSVGVSYCYNHDMAFHMAKMTDLIPGEEVNYRVGDGNTWSDEFSFIPIDNDMNHFEWIAIADHGDSTEALEVTDAIIADSEARLVTISGDISYADGEQSAWDNWFLAQEESMRKIPWITAVGNHENEPGYGFTPYTHRFDSDGVHETETFWYSRDIPGAHLVFMSTEHDYTPGSEQYKALEADFIAANANRENFPFIIVMGHSPMYSSNSNHGSEYELREALEILYIEQGVDLVIAGHDHFYERTWPVYAEEVQDKGTNEGTLFARGSAPIHIVAGTAGRSAYEELDEPKPDWSAYRESSTYGYMRLVYDGENKDITFTFYRIDGSIGDSFTIQNDPLENNSNNGTSILPGFDIFLLTIALVGAAIYRQSKMSS